MRASLLLSLVGFLSIFVAFTAEDAQALTASASANATTFVVGQTVSITAGLTNPSPGVAGAADVYAGLLRPDNTILFFTGTGIVIGNLTSVSSFRPLATGVALASAFSASVPNFYSHQWTVADSQGSYVFFVAAVKAGALAAGILRNEDILALGAASFTFDGGPGALRYRVTLGGDQLAIGSTIPVAFDYSYPSVSGTSYTLTIGDVPNQPFGRYDVCYRGGAPGESPPFGVPTPSARFLNINGGGGPLNGCATVTLSAQNPIGTFTFNFR